MDIKIYEKMLPKEAIDIRITVFTDEQGFFDEFDDTDRVATHFIAFDGEKAKTNLDEDEFLEVEWTEIEKVKQMLDSGEIKDGKTIIALQRYFLSL